MPFTISKPTSLMSNGSAINATYWRIGKIYVDQINQIFTLTAYGYADESSWAASPASYLMQQDFSYPNINGPSQYPFNPTYMATNFAAAGALAYLLSAEHYLSQLDFFSGATQSDPN